MSGKRSQNETAAQRLLPDTLTWRELLALPLYILLVLLYTLAAVAGFTADKIAGKRHSLNLLDWRLG